MGIYQLFADRGVPVGAMMNKTRRTPTPFWLFYFNVDNSDAAPSAVTDRGGQILFGPVEVPGGSWIANARSAGRESLSWGRPMITAALQMGAAFCARPGPRPAGALGVEEAGLPYQARLIGPDDQASAGYRALPAVRAGAGLAKRMVCYLESGRDPAPHRGALRDAAPRRRSREGPRRHLVFAANHSVEPASCSSPRSISSMPTRVGKARRPT